MIATNGTEYKSSYVSRDGEILNVEYSGITVPPTGENPTYLPTIETGSPEGCDVDIMLGNNGPVNMAMTATYQILDVLHVLQRWIESIGIANYTGVALFE